MGEKMGKRKKIILSIVIPCLNEEKTIREAIFAAHGVGDKYLKGLFEVIVADNGSTDNSIKIVRATKKARLVNVPIRGYGAALHWGILNSRGSYVFFADADMSYDFYEMGKFLKFMRKKYDVVLGSRFKGKIHNGAMPSLNRYVGTPLLTWLIRTIYKIRTTDSNSGMRMVRKDFYETLHMRNSGMEWDSELLIKTKLIGGKYTEVPINLYKDRRDSPPRLSRFTDGWRNLKTIVLIRPNSLIFPLVSLWLLVAIFFKISIGLSFFFLFLSAALILSIFAAKLLNFAITNISSKTIVIMNKIPIVFTAIITTLLAVPVIFFISDEHFGIKLFLGGAVAIVNMWVFLIETIRTHLINSLPEKF